MSRQGEAPALSVRTRAVALAVLLAWAGLLVHNAIEFPSLPFSRPDYAIPTLAWLVTFLIWWRFPGPRWPATLLLVWAGISLLGAVTTVLPLPFLPFRPEQSLRHYGVHVVYALTQLPVLRLAWRSLYSGRVPSSEGAA
jgi:hypothetical protein